MSDTAAPETPVDDIRPIVAKGPSGNWGVIGFIAVLLIGGLFLFNAMSAAREEANAPSTLAPAADQTRRITAPGTLALPQRFAERDTEVGLVKIEPRNENLEPFRSRIIASPPPSISQPQSSPRLAPARPLPNFPPPLPLPAEPAPIPQVVFNNRTPEAAAPQASNEEDPERVTASRFQNPSRTVPKGTVIPAVLETALDSTRPGGVRALVQRNVKSFDGTRILIQRGSRLYGEYDADLQAGQKRARIQWTRLIRPDGVTIALDSPASDPLGRAGVKGKVDTKFFQRFGGAVLQSVLDIGVGIATREASDGVVVALPGSTQNVQINDQQSILPTLKVKHGTSVSVFVARDLDFSTVEF
jgi:type IV secretion system protein VirB10